MADEPITDEQLEALRQALNEAMLMHTGRSIGDLASGQVARDVVSTLHAWLQQQLEKQVAFPVYGPESTAVHEPMSDRWLKTFRREIALAFDTHHSGPIAEAVTRNAEKDLFYLIEEYQRLRAREAAAMEIVRAVAQNDMVIPLRGSARCVFWDCEYDGISDHSSNCPVTKARALAANEGN